VHCGLCHSACPTYLELGTEADSPRGRIHLLQALGEGRIAAAPDVLRHLDLCLGCRSCETACPSGVPYGRLLEEARPSIEAHRPAPARWLRRLLGRALTTGWLRSVLVLPLRPFAGQRVLARLGAFGALLAAVPRGRQPPLPARLDPLGRPRGTAVVLTGCVADTLCRSTTRAAADLLCRAGFRVLVPPGQGCCGALALHLGDRERAAELARRLARMLATTDADVFVPTAAGCGAAVREWETLLPGDPAARAIAGRTRDPLVLLAETGLPLPCRSLAATVAVHDPCHLVHAQGVRGEPRALLATIPGVRLVELEEADICCGSAGTYNLTEPTMAARLLARKLERIVASGATVVAAGNPGCLLQIRAGVLARGLRVAVEHPLDLLARAHGLA